MKSAILLQERSFKTKLSRKYMDYNDKVGKQLMTLYEVQAYLPLEPVNTMYTASKLEVICSWLANLFCLQCSSAIRFQWFYCGQDWYRSPSTVAITNTMRLLSAGHIARLFGYKICIQRVAEKTSWKMIMWKTGKESNY